MKSLISIVCFNLCLLILACQPSSTSASQESLAEQTPTPEQAEESNAVVDNTIAKELEAPIDYTINLPADLKMLSKAQGDLTKNGIDEQVFVVEPLVEEAEYMEAPPRRVQVYRLAEGEWQLWQEIPGGVLSADEGGMFGDPFQEVTIKRGALVIEHYGGSRIRWHYTHRFRWQNEQWQLIGATIVYGAPCDYWHTYDYNLSTDKVVAKWEVEDCDTEETTVDSFSFDHRIRPLPNMADFIPGETAVEVPERDTEFYF